MKKQIKVHVLNLFNRLFYDDIVAFDKKELYEFLIILRIKYTVADLYKQKMGELK